MLIQVAQEIIAQCSPKVWAYLDKYLLEGYEDLHGRDIYEALADISGDMWQFGKRYFKALVKKMQSKDYNTGGDLDYFEKEIFKKTGMKYKDVRH